MDINEKYKSWDTLKYKYNLNDKEKFWWLQLVNSMPKLWVEVLNKDLGLFVNLQVYDHNLIKNSQLYILDKLVSKEKNYLKQQIWNGKKYKFYQERFL